MSFLKMLAALSVGGSVLGLALMLLRRLAGKKLPASFFYAAWLLVLLRFVLPFHGFLPVREPKGAEVFKSPVVVSQTSAEIGAVEAIETMESSFLPFRPETMNPVPEASPAAELRLPEIETVLLCIWGLGIVVVLGTAGIRYFRFSVQIRRGLKKPLNDDNKIYNSIRFLMKPKLARSDALVTPMTFGLFRPVLVIPCREYDTEELNFIISHELVHFSRGDILRKWLMLCVAALHWFNPLMLLFRREMDALCELSCDEILLHNMNREEQRRYGEILLNLAENACRLPSAMMTGFADEKKNLKERLLQIMSFQKKGKLALVFGAVLALLLASSAFALGPQSVETEHTSRVTVSDVDEFLAAIAPNTEITLSPGVYNLTKAETYGKNGASLYYRWGNLGFAGEYALELTGIDGLKLIGNNAEIVTVPRTVNVLSFENCDDLTLKGLAIGHTEETEACEGGVVHLQRCSNTVIDGCSLYGCGTIGVWAEESSRLFVTNSDVHHCSSSGIYFYGGLELQVENCRIYDCGSPERYQAASALILLSDASDIRISNCEVYGNVADSLVRSYGVSDAEAAQLSIHDNHFTSLLACDSAIAFRDLEISGNVIDRFLNAYSTMQTANIDGADFSEEDLRENYGDQLSSAGIGAVEADFAVVEHGSAKEVHVSTADEFLAAIASNTIVYLDAPIDLTTAADYGEDASENNWEWLPQFGDRTYIWRYVYDGYELCIGNVHNFYISGQEIITHPRYANVLNFYSCSDISLENVYMGHSPERGSCSGGVVYLVDCQDVLLEGCDLYGCGILGITANNVRNLQVQRTKIHDCSEGAVMIFDSENVTFLGCSVENCPDPHFCLQGCIGFSWERKLMDPYCAFNVSSR